MAKREKGWSQQQSFCPAPWVHSHIDAQGLRRLCCVAKPAPRELAKLELSDYWNSSYMKKIRSMMASGMLPDECASCVVPNRIGTYKDSLRMRYGSRSQQIEKMTSDDGFSRMPLLFLDYRSHVCNLKCKTCGPESSSAWLAHARSRLGAWSGIVAPSLLDEIVDSLKKSAYSKEFLAVIRNHPIEMIYFAGGEPLLSTTHQDVLTELITSGRSKNVSLTYNTNLMVPTSKIEKWADQLAHFDSVYVAVSVDGTKDVSEYIRSGMSFEIFEENLRILKARLAPLKNCEIVLDATITSLFLVNLNEFCKWAMSKGLRVVAKLMIANQHRAAFLRCEAVPQNLRRKIVDDWYHDFVRLSEKDQALLRDLKNCLDLVVGAPELSDIQIRDLHRQAQINAQVFDDDGTLESILSKNDYLWKWWTSGL